MIEIKRLPSETPEAFDAFLSYVEILPQERSAMKAYIALCEQNKVKPDKYLPPEWSRWQRTYNWSSRAKEIDENRKKEVQWFISSEQISELIAYRKRQRELAEMVTDTAMRMIAAANRRLETLNPEEITASVLPQYLKAAAAIAELASDAEAKILLLQDIVEMYNANFGEKDEFMDNLVEDDSTDALEEMFK